MEFKVKKYISFVIAAVVLTVMICIPASALQGKWSEITWQIADGILTVSGGDIPDCTASSAAPWMKFADRVTKIVVDSSVKSIGNRAFEDMNCTTSVSLTGTVNIGEMAFSGCSSLTEVSLPESVISIGDFAFAECSSLKTVSLPASVTSIGKCVWEACPSLSKIDSNSDIYYSNDGVLIDKNSSSILRYPPARKGTDYTVPSTITAVSTGAFRDCTVLESVHLSGVHTIGDGAFYGCTALSDIALDSVTKIGRSSFWGCSSLSEIQFPQVLAEIGNEAFAYCDSLAIADFTGNAPVAEKGIFHGCGGNFTVVVGKDSSGFGETSWLGYPVIRHGVYSGQSDGITWSLDSSTGVMTISGEGNMPDYEYASDTPWYPYRRIIRELQTTGITYIGQNSFRYSSLSKLNLSSEVTSVGNWAFSGCAFLKSVTAEGLLTIGECAFFGDTSLLCVKLPVISDIGKQSFSGCDSLKWALTGTNAPLLGEYAFDGADVTVLYPKNSTGYSGGDWDSVYSEQYTPGDADGDGYCSITDAMQMLKYIAKWDGITIFKVAADTDINSSVTIIDVINILKYIAKWDIKIGIESLLD